MMIAETRIKTADAEKAETEAMNQKINLYDSLAAKYAAYCPNKVMDDDAQLLFKDSLLKILQKQGACHF